MAQINFSRIIEEINYGSDPFGFILSQDADVIVPLDFQKTESSIFNYISLNEVVDTTALETVQNRADIRFGKFAEDVRRVLGAPGTFIYDYIENPSAVPAENATGATQFGVARISIIPGTTSDAVSAQNKIFVIKFNSSKEVKILESGIGKNFSWAKITFRHKVDGVDVERNGYCNLSKLTNKPGNNKELIKNFPGLAIDIFKTSLSEKIKPVSDFYQISLSDAEPDKIIYDKNTASYLILAPTNIENLITTPEINIKTEFSRVFSQVIKKTLAFEKRRQTYIDGTQDKNFEDKFYLFSKIVDYYISPRPVEPLYILIKVPLRNIYAVSENADNLSAAADVIETIVGGVNSAQQYLKSLDGKKIYDFSQGFGNINDFLVSSSPNSNLNSNVLDQLYNNPSINAGLNSLPLISDDRSSDYVSLSAAKNVLNRKIYLYFPFFEEQCYEISKVLKYYKDEINKERQKPEEEQKIIYNIDLEFYEKYFKELPNLISSFINDYSTSSFMALKRDGQSLVFVFDNLKITRAFLYSSEGKASELKGFEQLIENLPFNDETFIFLLCNFEKLYSISTSQKAVTDFLSEFIAPEELAYYQYVNPSFNEREIKQGVGCLKTQAQTLKESLKRNTNDFIADLRIAETKKNFEDSFTTKKEWQKTVDNLKDSKERAFSSKESGEEGIFTDWRKGFLNPRTINWDVIISEIARCISDKEARETIEWLAAAIKDDLLDNKPILCSIPSLQIPRFPSISLPPIPNFPSILNNLLVETTNATISARQDAILAIIRSIVEAAEICRSPDNSLDIGASDAEDQLVSPNSSPLSSDRENIASADSNRKNQFLNSGIVENDQDSSIAEIKLLLSEVSKNLTRAEILSLYSKTSNDKTIRIVKLIVKKLQRDSQIPNLSLKLGSTINEKYVPSDIKIIDFFAKFVTIVDPNAVQEQQQQQDILSNDPDLLCKEPSEIDQNYASRLIKRGIPEDVALEEAKRRRDDIRKKLGNLVEAINLLKKDSIELPPLNCRKNLDGSVTPGISDKLTPSKEIENIQNTHIETFYSSFDNEYNSNFKNWFNIAVATNFGTEPDTNNITGSTVEFLGFYPNANLELSKSDGTAILKNKFTLTSDPVNINSNEGNSQELRFSFLSPLENSSNKIINFFETSISGSGLALTSSISSIRNFETDFLSNEDKEKIKNKFSFQSKYFQTSSNAVLETYSRQLGKELDPNIISQVREKYSSKLIEYRKKSFYFKKAADSLIINGQSAPKGIKLKDKELDTPESPIATKINLNPIRNKKEIICKKPDLRLINILDAIKADAKKAGGKGCVQPKYLPDGKKEPSEADNANLLGAVKLFLRIYAIDFNLKLLPYGNFLSFIKTDTFYETCYQLFIKDLENLFGKTFKNKIVKKLADQYAIDEKIEDPIEKILLEQGKYNIKAFIKYFRDDHFIAVNKQIKDLIKSPINESRFSKSIWENFEKDLFEKTYEDLIDYEFSQLEIFSSSAKFDLADQKQNALRIGKILKSIFVIYSEEEGAIGGTQKINTYSLRLLKDDFSKSPDYIKRYIQEDFTAGPATENLDRKQFLKTVLRTSPVLLTIVTTGNIKEDPRVKESFTLYLKNVVLPEEILSVLLRQDLAVLSSVNKLNSVFNSCKKEIKVIIDTIEYSNDFNKNIEDDGTTEIFSRLKVLANIPEFMIKSMAESIDPNVSISSKISLAYETGVALAASAGIDIPIKKLPLFVTAPMLFPAFLFPISPFGIPAILLSLKDLNIDFDSSTTTEDDYNKENC